MVSLKATLQSIASPELFDCGRCLAQYDDIRDVEQRNTMLQAVRNAKSCEGSAPEPRHHIRDAAGRELRFLTCVGNWVRPGWFYWHEAYANYQRGVLPFPGSLCEQPAKAMDILMTIGSFEHQRVLERAEEEKARAARPPGMKRRPRGRQ